MRNRLFRFIALFLLSLFVLSSCGAPADDSDNTMADDSSARIEDTGDEKELEIYIEREDKEVKNILMIGKKLKIFL